ncbi:tumor necrosis factor receptor superfamily member 5 isoform X1 [Sorex araneus]|uniref:tumor necrosis factor receptor superfamily member 5 isoform X1 n=1 Tax=Sorex araneus TaxID=42254 RepID=UPI002433C917|nr:tumor necrosis factor receptor superfamily member 5 isoform X1 [Sorex araneus]
MVRLALQSLFWGCLLTPVLPESPAACRENQYSIDGQCCDLCQPGKKLVKDCSEAAGTECISCGQDEFLGTWNREPRCHQHRYCDHNLGLRVLREGTPETDTTCTCAEGQHCTSEACESCVPHSPCAPGSGVRQTATGTQDTVCEACPVGFFSNVSSAFDKCRPWRSCEALGLVELRAGTNVTDAVCGVQDRTRTLVALPVVLAILCMALVVPACIWKWSKKKPEEGTKLQDLPTPQPEESEYLSPVQETLLRCQPVAQEDGKESRVSVQERL